MHPGSNREDREKAIQSLPDFCFAPTVIDTAVQYVHEAHLALEMFEEMTEDVRDMYNRFMKVRSEAPQEFINRRTIIEKYNRKGPSRPSLVSRSSQTDRPQEEGISEGTDQGEGWHIEEVREEAVDQPQDNRREGQRGNAGARVPFPPPPVPIVDLDFGQFAIRGRVR